jgi:hypothetical protein
VALIARLNSLPAPYRLPALVQEIRRGPDQAPRPPPARRGRCGRRPEEYRAPAPCGRPSAATRSRDPEASWPWSKGS